MACTNNTLSPEKNQNNKTQQTSTEEGANQTEKPNECPNLGIGDKRGVGMDAKRAERFYSAMCRMNRAVISLNAAANTFPRIDLDADQMDPATTVRAICRPVIEDINLLYLMIENEDGPEEQQKGGV